MKLQFVLLWSYNTYYISLRMVQNLNGCFWWSHLFHIYRQYRKKIKLEQQNISLYLVHSFIKSTDNRPFDHGPLTHQPPTQWLVESLIKFERLDNYGTQAQLGTYSYTWLYWFPKMQIRQILTLKTDPITDSVREFFTAIYSKYLKLN